jgi:hypothetical protein
VAVSVSILDQAHGNCNPPALSMEPSNPPATQSTAVKVSNLQQLELAFLVVLAMKRILVRHQVLKIQAVVEIGLVQESWVVARKSQMECCWSCCCRCYYCWSVAQNFPHNCYYCWSVARKKKI